MTNTDYKHLISERDLDFLVALGDTRTGYIARGEYAESANVPVASIDRLVLCIIYGEDIESN